MDGPDRRPLCQYKLNTTSPAMARVVNQMMPSTKNAVTLVDWRDSANPQIIPKIAAPAAIAAIEMDLILGLSFRLSGTGCACAFSDHR
jgi:hypothetical protein